MTSRNRQPEGFSSPPCFAHELSDDGYRIDDAATMNVAAGLDPSDRGALALALLDGMPDALVVSDAKGVITYWNAGAGRIFGFTREEALGQSLDIIIPEKLRARHWSGYEHTVQTGESRYGVDQLLSVPALCKDGRRISVQFSITLLTASDGRVMGMAAIMRDVTAGYDERKKLRAALAGS